jgi:8-oxo-dGTP diphosphatase
MDRAFYESLPKKRMGSGCLFFDAEGKVLLVKPTYKESWEIVGGVVEDNESPKAACEREIEEEIGLRISVGALLVVDYNAYPADSSKTESLMFVFDGGMLSAENLARIRVQENEISHCEFFSVEALPDTLQINLAARIRMAVQQKASSGTIYLENQQVVY